MRNSGKARGLLKSICTIACAAILLFTLLGVSAYGQLKIAAVYLIPAVDGGFCETLHRGLTAAAGTYGYDYAFSENVSTADAEGALRGYAERGYNIIFAHTTGYKAAVERVAPDYPNVLFALFAGSTGAPNVVMYDWYGNEACYLLGVIAGMTTATNTIGHIGGMKVPNQLRYLAGFIAGVKSVNPDAQLPSVFTGSFTDAAAGKEVATTLLEQGADVLFDTMGLAWIGVKDLTAEMGGHILADYGYKAANAPEVILAGQVVYYDKLLEQLIADRDAGTLKPQYWASLANGMLDILYSGSAGQVIPYVVRTQVEKAKQEIISGAVVVPMTMTP